MKKSECQILLTSRPSDLSWLSWTKVSLPQYCSHFGPANPLLWRVVLCSIGYLALSLSFP